MWNTLLSIGISLSGVCQDSTINPAFAAHLNRIYRHTIPVVTVHELKDLIRSGVVLLDAREEEEYAVSHLRHARHVGFIWFDMRNVYDIDKTDTVVVYCAIGNRSERIAEKLRRAGYRNVYHLFGGIYEWVNQHNPVYNRSNIQTTEVHVYDRSWAHWLQHASPVD